MTDENKQGLNKFRESDTALESQDKESSKDLHSSSNNSFLLKEGVKYRKNHVLKIKCDGAIQSVGLSNQQFYDKVKISRQQWYAWSWGLEPFPIWLKIKLCDLFGKPFRDLFLEEQQ